MSTGQVLVLRGALIGSLLVAVLCFFITSGVSPTEAKTLALQAAPSAGQAASPLDAAHPSEISQSSECRISENYPPKIQQWCGLITMYADESGLSPDLVAAVMLQESGGNPLAYSRSGAVGLMQVMPRDGLAASFVCNGRPCFASRPTIEELQDPEYNVAYGTRMLAGLIARLGNVRDALRAYGPKDVGYYYPDKVLAIYENYGEE